MKTHFEKQRPRLLGEAMLKSVLCGGCIGLFAGFVSALVAWITPGFDFWISFVVFLIVGALSTAAFFRWRFKLDEKNNARRIDRLGLEERLVTMLEYQDDDSVIAQMQRKDAMAALETVDPKRIEYRVAPKIYVTFAIAAFISIGMLTVSILGDFGLLPSAYEIGESILNPEEPEVYLSVTYIAEEGGTIVGVADQLVLKGTMATPVTAVADNGYEFLYWDDGFDVPSREQDIVLEELVLTAVFGTVEGDIDEDDDVLGTDTTGGDPYQNGVGNGNMEYPGDKENDNALMGTGQFDDFNQIIDGETYYRLDIELYRQKIREYLEEHGDELTPRQRAIIEAYINIV